MSKDKGQGMKRRDFLKAGVAASGGTLVSRSLIAQAADRSVTHGRFKLNYAPHFGMFKHSAGNGFLDQIRFAADQGFTAWEDNGLKARPLWLQQAIARTLDSLGMQMGAFEATSTFRDLSLTGQVRHHWERVLEEIHESVEVAKRVNAKWMTVVPGRCDASRMWVRQRANCVDLLKRCCQILEPHGLVMVVEPPNVRLITPECSRRRIPPSTGVAAMGKPSLGCEDLPFSVVHAAGIDVALSQFELAHQMCRAVGSPACKLLCKINRRQNGQGETISSIDSAWSEIGYFHCRDNPVGVQPDTGTNDCRRVFRHLHSKGYAGIVGMEHGNPKPGRAGDLAVVEAYAQVDRF